MPASDRLQGFQYMVRRRQQEGWRLESYSEDPPVATFVFVTGPAKPLDSRRVVFPDKVVRGYLRIWADDKGRLQEERGNDPRILQPPQ